MAKVLVLGGRGYVGKALCKELQKKHTVYTFDRSKGGKRHYQGNVLNPEDLAEACKGKKTVINLVGLSPLRTPEPGAYQKLHIDAVKEVIRACRTRKIKHLIHMSVLGADTKAKTHFLRTRGKGEELVRESGVHHTIFRPSLIFDKENELIHLCKQTCYTCLFPDIPAKVQPVYRGDVAKMFTLATEGKLNSKRLALGGPQRMTVFSLAKRIYAKQGFPCYPLPLELVRPGMRIAAFLGLFGVGEDQITSLELDNVTNSRMLQKHVKPTRFDDWLKRVRL